MNGEFYLNIACLIIISELFAAYFLTKYISNYYSTSIL